MMRILLVLLACGFLSACEALQSEAADRMIDEETRAIVDLATDAALAGDLEPVRPLLHPAIPAGSVDGGFAEILAILPDGAPDRRSLIGYQFSNNVTVSANGTVESRRRTAVVLLVYGEDKYGLIQQLYAENDEPLRITTLRVVLYDPAAYAAPEVLTRPHQIFLAAAIGVPVFVILTLIAMYRLKRVKRRILWTLFILLACYPVFQLNWTTGSWQMLAPAVRRSGAITHYQLFELSFLGGGYSRAAEVEPAFLLAAIPIGALFFWLKLITVGIRRKPPKGEAPVAVPEQATSNPPAPDNPDKPWPPRR
ncbi:MAG: hypothetical protein GC208_08100 [Alphaproteobacteria bacterium]|nr:hypothetical protein [Alphaproteobacteria bacterium]